MYYYKLILYSVSSMEWVGSTVHLNCVHLRYQFKLGLVLVLVVHQVQWDSESQDIRSTRIIVDYSELWEREREWVRETKRTLPLSGRNRTLLMQVQKQVCHFGTREGECRCCRWVGGGGDSPLTAGLTPIPPEAQHAPPPRWSIYSPPHQSSAGANTDNAS